MVERSAGASSMERGYLIGETVQCRGVIPYLNYDAMEIGGL